MGIHIISDAEVDEFLEESDTEPMILLTVNDLVVADRMAAFKATADRLEPKHWTEKLIEEIEAADVAEVLDRGFGWAGRAAR